MAILSGMSISSNHLWTSYLRLIALWVLFSAVYFVCNWITAGRSDVGVIRFEWERGIPFLPWMIVPYMSIWVLFGALPFLVAGKRAIDAVIRRSAAATLVAGACFLAFPLQMAEPRPSAPGFLGGGYDLLKTVDGPYNLCPSLHVAYLLILWTVILRGRSALPAAALHAWCSLVLVSVLFVHQHHFIDMVGGAALALGCIVLIHTKRVP